MHFNCQVLVKLIGRSLMTIAICTWTTVDLVMTTLGFAGENFFCSFFYCHFIDIETHFFICTFFIGTCFQWEVCDLQVFNNLHRSECSSLGGSLASIHSKEENDFVFNLIQPHGPATYYGSTWVGATCVNGEHKWDDGTPWDYENWDSGYLAPLNNTWCHFCEEN